MSEPAVIQSGPPVIRVRHELRRRELTVLRVERPGPQMVRAVLGGPELAGFTSLGFDDHVKLFFPAGEGAPDQSVMRDFTPRHHDAGKGELWIDFFLHEAGPAASWASQVQPGQSLTIGGPRGSMIIETADIDLHVLIGDETALPAIQRRLEELPSGERALVVVETDAGTVWPAPASKAAVETHWVPRDGRSGEPAHELLAALRTLTFPSARSFCWVAGETQSARALRRYLVEERGIGRRWVKASGYWQRGAVGAHERLDEE